MSYYTHKSPTGRNLKPSFETTGEEVGVKAWRALTYQYSAVESEIYPFDPKVIRAIRDLDPAFVPLVVRSIFASPTGSLRQFEHHAIAWRLTTPQKNHKRRRVLWPTNPGSVNAGKGGTALFLEHVLRGDDLPSGLPGPFKPISWGTYYAMNAALKYAKEAPSVEEEVRQLENREQEAHDKRERALLAETEYRIDHDERQLKAALEADNTPDGLRTLGMARPFEPKPHVFVGGNAA